MTPQSKLIYLPVSGQTPQLLYFSYIVHNEKQARMTVVNDTAVLFFYTDDLLVVNGNPYEDGSVDDKIVRLDEDNVDDKSGRPDADNLLVPCSTDDVSSPSLPSDISQHLLVIYLTSVILHDTTPQSTANLSTSVRTNSTVTLLSFPHKHFRQ